MSARLLQRVARPVILIWSANATIVVLATVVVAVVSPRDGGEIPRQYEWALDVYCGLYCMSIIAAGLLYLGLLRLARSQIGRRAGFIYAWRAQLIFVPWYGLSVFRRIVRDLAAASAVRGAAPP